MLYFVSVWILLLIASEIIGIGLLNQLKVSAIGRRGDRSLVALWLGVILLANTLLLLSLVVPLTPIIGLLIIVGLCAAFLISSQTRVELNKIRSALSASRILGFLILAIAIASFTTRQVTWSDSGLYHYQSIQWLAQFGTVPGVALLQSNLGFTSSWFALSAPFNASTLNAAAGAAMNGFAVLLAAIHGWLGLAHCIKRQALLSDWFAIALWSLLLPLLLGLNSLSEILVSPSPDIPCILLVSVTAWAILVCASSQIRSQEVSEANDRACLSTKTLSIDTLPTKTPPTKIPPTKTSPTKSGVAIVALLLATGAVTIKLIAIPLFCVTGLFYLLSDRLTLRAIGQGSLAVGLLLSPLLICSIVTSGCPLFPSTLLCLDLPWSPAQAALKAIADHTHNPATWNDPAPSGTHAWFWSLQQWFSSNASRRFLPVLLGISFVGAAVVVGSLLFLPVLAGEGQLWVTAVGISGTVFLLAMSPFFRFMVSYILVPPALMVALFLRAKWGSELPEILSKIHWRSKILRLPQPLFLPFLFALAIAVTAPRHSYRLFLPPPVRSVPTQQQQVNDVTYFSPQEGLCWATQLPCTPAISADIRLREPARGIGGGFVRKQ